MKILILLLLFTRAWAFDPYATPDLLPKRGQLEPPPSVFASEDMEKVLFSELKYQSDELKKVKFYLVNGEVRLAEAYLSNLAYTRSKLRPITKRYLAILSFIQSDFEKTYAHLSAPELQAPPHFSKICTLKVLSEIVLSKKTELEKDWVRCQLENPGNFRERNLVWFETLVELKLRPYEGASRVPFKNVKLMTLQAEELKVMIKLALYLNQERLIVDQLPELTLDQLQDPEVRELAGQIFFRTGALAKSYKFTNDLKSPNSENIKGNLYLLRNKYELAYAQFKLALEQKQNSQNALERLLPLAWLLGDWENGTRYAEQLAAAPETRMNKLTLMAAFLMQKGDYEAADKTLTLIANRSRKGTELDVTQLASYTALMQNKPEVARKQSLQSCEQYDLLNCWLFLQLGQWDAFSLTIRREDKIGEKREWEKLAQGELDDPIQETVFVNQLDIEEMDDKLIQLIPKS